MFQTVLTVSILVHNVVSTAAQTQSNQSCNNQQGQNKGRFKKIKPHQATAVSMKDVKKYSLGGAKACTMVYDSTLNCLI